MKNYITIGTYDGVHLGHRKVIHALVKESRKRGMKSLVLYFPFPPRAVISGARNSLITLPHERKLLLESLGVDKAQELPFTAEMAATGHRTFFREILLKHSRAGGIIVGRDFVFGRDRRGDVRFIRRECRKNSLYFKIVPFVMSQEHRVSSSAIRTLLKSGDISGANHRLGRHYEVSGKVVKGSGFGRLLGFHTANIDVDPAKILPPGVFAVRVGIGHRMYYGAANVGVGPTVKGSGAKQMLEVHILNFSTTIVGRMLKVEFLRRIRSERKFASVEALQRQILKDVKTAHIFCFCLPAEIIR